jgi:class 3 adenylate cyclase
MARALLAMWLELDVRGVLPSIGVPTLVLHRSEEVFPIEPARDIAAHLEGARFVELPGSDHAPWVGNADAYLAEIEEFLTGTRARSVTDRVLASGLLTAIVGSPVRAAGLGVGAWRALLGRHDELVRAELRRYGGREVKQTGDGFLLTFDGPARAIRCAQAILAGARDRLGLEVRAGVHTGEVDLVEGDVRGMAVHIAARVGALAGPGEVLVSSTVRDLVIGSGIELEERGRTTLKGVPGEWSLFRAAGFG